MKNKWLDWQPDTQIISKTPEIEPAKTAKTAPLVIPLSISDPTPITSVAETTVSRMSRALLHHLADRWLREHCIVTRLCASSLRGLGRAFSEWAKLPCDASMEHLFAEELLQRGFAADESGMVSGLVLTEDLGAALKYERAAYQSHVRSLTVERRWK